jgi:type IV pilus assembly protein PilA
MNRKLPLGIGSSKLLAVLGGVVVLGALAYVVAYPAYEDYQAKKQLEDVFASTDYCRTAVEKIIKTTTATELSTSLFGCDGGASGGVRISRHLKSIAIGSNGAMTVTLNFRSLPGLSPYTNTLTLVPLDEKANVLGLAGVRQTIHAWRCGSPSDGTTVPVRYLPANCRG